MRKRGQKFWLEETQQTVDYVGKKNFNHLRKCEELKDEK